MATIILKRKYDKTISCEECFLNNKKGKYITICAKSDCISKKYVFVQVEKEVDNG